MVRFLQKLCLEKLYKEADRENKEVNAIYGKKLLVVIK